jgi:hypothetical protein
MATILRGSANPSVGNFNDTATWVGGVVPGSGDIVVFDINSGSLTINTTGITISAIDFTNFVGTVYVNNTFTVKGNTGVSGGYVQLGTGGYTVVNNNAPAPPSNSNAGTTTFMSLITDGNFNIQTNGAECNFILKFNTSDTGSGGSAYTFTIDSFTSKQIYLYTATSSGAGYFINGGILSCKSFVYFNGSNAYTIQGTATLKFIGGGSTPGIYTSDSSAQGNIGQPILALNVTIDTPWTFTINVSGTNGAIYYGGTATFTYTSGTISWTGTNVWGFWTTGNPTWRVGGTTLPKMSISGSQPQFQELASITYLWIVSSTSLRGAYGINMGTMDIRAFTQLQTPNIYNVSTAFYSYLATTSASAFRITLTGLGGFAYLNVSPNAVYRVGGLNITYIDASGGRKIWTWDSTVSNSINASSYPDLGAISHNY